MEIDEKANTHVEEAEMGKQLRLVDGMQSIFAFDFNDDFVVYDQISAEAAFELNAVIDEGDGFLALNREAALLQFMCETGLVSGFE